MSTNATGHDPEEELHRRIKAKGPITFAEFQEVALYWSHGGYYVGQPPLGARGDFYTAPLTHPVFGALISRQIAQMWRLMGEPEPFTLTEPGAGSGRLAADVVSHLALEDPSFLSALRYTGVDLSEPTVALPESVSWRLPAVLPADPVTGCVLANELLDAMPAHRVVQQDGRLQEVLVGLDERGAFTDVVAEPSTPALAQRFEALGIRLSEGYRAEVNLRLEPWLQDVAHVLDRGYVLLIDYGHEAATLYDESRRHGTLRCYYRHTLNANAYRHVGQQDISVHVDFTSVRRIAESVGLKVLGYITQAEFLANLGLAACRDDVARRKSLAPQERRANLRAMDVLADPEGMGGFKVMALAKHVPDAPLWGFDPETQLKSGAVGPHRVAAPLATPGHMPWAGQQGQSDNQLPPWRELLR